MFAGIKARLARLAALIPKPEPQGCDPRLARAALMAAGELPPRGTKVPEYPGDITFTDEELEPVWRAVADMQDRIEADPDYRPPEVGRFDDEDDEDDDGAF